MVPAPPITTEGTVPNQAAVTPDSNSPNSLDAPIKSEFTALTRPRISSGVASWIKVTRTYTLTMSEAPSNASATTDSVKSVESPNTIVATPKIAIQPNIAKPALRRKGTRPATSTSRLPRYNWW